MDLVLYISAAIILVVLIVFALKVRGRAEQTDNEVHEQVAARAAAPPRAQGAVEDRGAGMPRRRRRGMQAAMEARRPHREQQPSDNEDSPVEVDDVEEEEESAAQLNTAKIGAKKQRKLEEKQQRKAQREAELEEREERKRLQEAREQERRKEDEKERLAEQQQEEQERRAKEEQEKKEEEEYQRLKESFIIEEQGVSEELTETESQNLLQEFIQYIKDSKVVLLEDLASHFGMRTQDAIARLHDLIADGSLTGVIDDRGKFISITPEELAAVASFIKQRGRVSISELVQASNTLINLTPVTRSNA
ncbi:DDRGK domain-containing protein 1-like isoform X2 [Engraulis encrasicolus]|uniref:DDRGK domain-containing protein 1-like isoform X1 n=1 Tax=Engraulis encrasicolus TaxID=184585 RepID=UPI002FD3204E